MLPQGRLRIVAAGLTVLTVAACSTAGSPAGPSPAASTPAKKNAPEVVNGRMGITFDGGVMIIEEETMKHLADLPEAGHLRLAAVGDKRHLLVTTADGFRVLDTGVEVRGHDGHFHLYGHEPTLTNTVFPAPKPGHAVTHGGRLALFSDEAGTIQTLKSDDVLKGPAAAVTTTVAPHHGVAVPTEDGGLVVSLPDRTGVNVLDAKGGVRATTTECPGLHGEAVSKSAISVGCTDGSLIIAGDRIVKAKSPDPYGRIGTQVGSPASDVVLGDYRTDKDAKVEPTTKVALVNATDASLRVATLPATYSFRSLGRGPNGEALILTTDGNLTVVDPGTGAVTGAIKVIEPWELSESWQTPRPALRVVGNVAYVTEPATSKLHAVHLPTAKVVDSVTLPHKPNEIQDVGLEGAKGEPH